MLKGLVVSPVFMGRIAIGGVTEGKNGKKQPVKNDFISITGMSQAGAENEWREHPVEKRLKEESGKDKLRSIPVRVLFNKPDSSFKSGFTAFDQKGRPLCNGNGDTARRRCATGLETVACHGPEICEFAGPNRCKQFARLMVGIEGEFQKDPLSAFVFRTTSYNSIKAITARLEYMAALTNGKIAGMPCNLVMRSKSTAASYRKPIFYLDLEPAGGLLEAIKEASAFQATWEAAGLNRDALEAAVTAGLNASEFFEASEDGAEVVEEFYTEVVDPETGEIVREKTPETKSEAKAPAPAEAVNDGVDLGKLLEESGRTLERLNTWLNRPAEEPLETLTAEQRAKVIQALTPVEA